MPIPTSVLYPPFHVVRLNHIQLTVTDLTRSRAFWADTVGLQNVVMTMEKFAKGRHGDAWKPAPLLAKLAAEGKTFN